MKSPSTDQNPQPPGCCSKFAGCLVSALLLPISISIFSWLAFVLGPMGCAFPSYCSSTQAIAKGILSMVVLIGGGFGIPIGTGILVNKVVQKVVVSRSKSKKDNE